MAYHVSRKLKEVEGDHAPAPEKRHRDGVTLLALIDSVARTQPPPGSALPIWIDWLQQRREIHRLLGEAFRITDHAHRMQAKHLDRHIARLTNQLARDSEALGIEPPLPGNLCPMCSSLPEKFRPPYVEWTCHVCHGGQGGPEVCVKRRCAVAGENAPGDERPSDS